MHTTRRQLSMYVAGLLSDDIEAARHVLDPVQCRLIPAHVTLCREDEIAELSQSELQRRFLNSEFKPITLHFGRPRLFSGHGVLIECIGGEDGFHSLREQLLGAPGVRTEPPHITLAHPRNPKSLGNSLANAARLPDVISIVFRTVSLIQQHGCQPWELLQTFELQGS